MKPILIRTTLLLAVVIGFFYVSYQLRTVEFPYDEELEQIEVRNEEKADIRKKVLESKSQENDE